MQAAAIDASTATIPSATTPAGAVAVGGSRGAVDGRRLRHAAIQAAIPPVASTTSP